MKKITIIALMLFTALGYAQVGVNTNTPDASSALEIESTTGGILIPRLTQTQRDAITAPATGLMIYQTNQSTGFYFFDGTVWTKINGVAGPQGEAGSQGIQGIQGDIGLTGATGPSGANGVNGSNGLAGAQGPQGEAGLQGIQGIQGDIGLTGATGPSGANGSNGSAGVQGPQGEAGPQGIQGLQGDIGLTGATGPSGANGVNGSNGSAGVQGPQGETGPQGIQGDTGASGTNGADGAQGPQGEPASVMDQGYVNVVNCTIPGATAYNSDVGDNVVCTPYLTINGSEQFLITNELVCPDNSEGVTTNIEYWISFEVSQPLMPYLLHFEPFANNSFCGNVGGDFREIYKVSSSTFNSNSNLGDLIYNSQSQGSPIPKLIFSPGFTYTIRAGGFNSYNTRTTSVTNYTINETLFNNVKFYSSSPDSFVLNEATDQWALLYNTGESYVNGNILTVFTEWELRWENN